MVTPSIHAVSRDGARFMVVIIAIVIIFVVNIFTKRDDPEISNTFISEKLEEVSELTSAELTYNGLASYSDGEIPLLTKKSFKMIYRAEVDAGIDLSEVEVEVTNSKVKILLPEAEVQDIIVDPDSLEFYDESFALFNWEDRDDTVEALKLAKEDVLENGNIEELKEKAQEQTEMLLAKMLEEFIGDRELVISYK